MRLIGPKKYQLLPWAWVFLLFSKLPLAAQPPQDDYGSYAELPVMMQPKVVDPKLQLLIDSINKLPDGKNADSLRIHLWAVAADLGVKGHYKDALDFYAYANETLPLAWIKDSNYRKHMTLILHNNLYVNYINLGRYDRGISHLAQAIAMIQSEEKYDDKIYYILLSNMGAALQNNGDSVRAQAYYERAGNWANKYGDQQLQTEILLLRAMASADSVAIPMFHLVLQQTRLQPNNAFRLMAQAALGGRLLNAKQEDSALLLLESAYSQMHQTHNTAYNIDLFIELELGTAYLQLKRYGRSEQLLQSAYQNAQERNDIYSLKKTAKQLVLLYKSIGNSEKAWYYQDRLDQWMQEVNQRDRLNAIGLMEVKYRTAEKDLNIARKQVQIEQQAHKLQRNRIWTISLSLFCLLLLLAGSGFLLAYRSRRKLRASDMEIAQLKAMMEGEERIRNTMATDLHDGIGGLLAAAKMKLSQPNGSPESYQQGLQLLDETYRELRYTAHNLSPLILKKEGLISAVQEFCHKVSDPNKTRFMVEALQSLPPLDPELELSLYRIIQELLQNIIKHADATEAWVQFSVSDQILHIIVQDNGKGMADNNPDKGIGLQQLKQRVPLLHGSMDIDSRPGTGTTFYLDFPWKKDYIAVD